MAVYGFGAIPKHMQQEEAKFSSCFPVNGNESAPGIEGLAGIIDTYRATAQAVTMSGPTVIAPVFKQFEEAVTSSKVYRVLVMMVDGEVDDFKQARDLLVSLSF